MGLSTLGDLVVSLGTLKEDDADLIVSFVSRIMRNNLCVIFGQAGTLECSQDIPENVKDQLIACMTESPLNTRIAESQGHIRAISPGDSVITQYGRGEVMIVADSTLGMGLPPRHIIQLPYGKLYSPANDTATVPVDRRASYSTPEELWAETARSAMTSMVVSLDVTHVVAVIFAYFDHNLRPAAISTILNALEVSHWHARSFNEDSRLSLALKSRDFMTFPGQDNPPNLLEQEVRTSGQILEITQLLATIPEYKTEAVTWVKRYTAAVIERYLELDASQQGDNPIDKRLIDAYKPAVMTVLEGLKDCSAERYHAFGEWMMPLVTKLILCHDFEVRVRVSSVLPGLVKHGEERK